MFEVGDMAEVIKEGKPAKIAPFDNSGLHRGSDGVIHYSAVDETLVAMLRRSTDSFGAAEAVVEVGGRRLTFTQFWDEAAKVAGGLRDLGIGVGDRVALQLPNGIDWTLAFFGTVFAGAVVVPVNTRFTESEVSYVLEDSGAKIALRLGDRLPVGESYLYEGASARDLAGIFYTSGTTGFPKGAMTSHENFISNIETARRVVPLPQGGARTLVSVPLFHVTGCNSQLLPALSLGGTTVVLPSFEVHSFLKTIIDENINLLTSVPAIYWLAMNQPEFAGLDLSGVEYLLYGGAPISPELVRRIKMAFPRARVGNGFGLSETASIATFLPHEYADLRPETVGFAAPPVELDLFEADAASGVGELLIRGPNVVGGYWNNERATQENFVAGWLHTGDMARLDDEGFCEIVDRKKDMVNRGGENVYCVEVENVLAEFPGVFEVAVLGVKDPMMGEKVGAIVVPVPGSSFNAAEMLEFASSKLADFKVPQYVLTRNEPLPRNAGGKVLKATLKSDAPWGAQLR